MPQYVPICLNMPQYIPIYPFFRDHLFVTTRVATRDGNFLIGAPFVSDRPRHLFFRPKKIGFGAGGRVWTFFDMCPDFQRFFLGLHKSREQKSVLR